MGRWTDKADEFMRKREETMDLQARINELTGQQQALMQRQQEDAVNTQRLAGAIAILNEQLAEDDAALPTEESEETDIPAAAVAARGG